MNGVAWAERPEHPRAKVVVARPQTDPFVPSWAGRTILGIATVAAFVVIGSPLGAGLSVVLLALGAVAARVRRPAELPTADLRRRLEPARPDAWRFVWWALAAGLALIPVLRAATWVVVPCVLFAAALASLAVGGGRAWCELSAGLAGIWARLPFGALVAGRAFGSLSGRGAALRATALTALLLLAFVPLLMSADAAFAEVLQRFVPDLDMPIERALGLALFATAGGALVYSGLAPLPAVPAPPARRTLSRLEWGLPLGALVALLGAFVALQLATLFGGERHVLGTAGLTYAEYARSGFAQLLVVAALTLGVVAAAHRWARGAGLRLLLAALCLLTLVVLASALKRLGLYEAAFGFTRLRFAAHAILLWLGAIFVLVLGDVSPKGLASLGALARRARVPAAHQDGSWSARAAWLPRAALAITGATILLFALADPDRRIAEHNVQRYERTGVLDRAYVARLSADAIPALAGFECRHIEPDSFGGFNLARTRARAACER